MIQHAHGRAFQRNPFIFVIDPLRQSLGVAGSRGNGVSRLAGTWSEGEHQEFLSAMAVFDKIDPELWK